MLHIVQLIERRHPEHAGKIITGLALLAASALAMGIALLLLS
jgi:hypothetical protein